MVPPPANSEARAVIGLTLILTSGWLVDPGGPGGGQRDLVEVSGWHVCLVTRAGARVFRSKPQQAAKLLAGQALSTHGQSRDLPRTEDAARREAAIVVMLYSPVRGSFAHVTSQARRSSLNPKVVGALAALGFASQA